MELLRTSRRKFVKTGGTAFAAAALRLRDAEGAVAIRTRGPSAVAPARDRVVVYGAPKEETLSEDYTVEVNGQSVPVYVIQSRWHDKKYSAAYFDFCGSVTVRIKTNLPVSQSPAGSTVRPDKYGIRPELTDGCATFTIDRPFDISFEPNGQKSPLHLFANPIEVDPPKRGDRNVIYFGPGIHKPDRIDLTTGQTLYIAGGAIVKAAVTSTGDNIRIMGRGILDGTDWPHFEGPATRMVYPSDGRNILLQDIIIRGSWTWTVAPTRCDHVTISNVRICGSRCGNDDGIDPCNSSNVTIRNCFIHTDDDGIAVKGTAETGQDPKPSENILVEDCTFWIDFANGFRLGAESRATACRNFVARNVDFIHLPDRNQIYVFHLHPEDNMPMENIVFEKIRIHGAGAANLARLTPRHPASPQTIHVNPQARNPAWRVPGVAPYDIVPGEGPYIHNVVFRGISVYGRRSSGPLPEIDLGGLSEANDVCGVTFENITVYGETITGTSSDIKVGKFVNQLCWRT
ncbi:MAG TPA: glycosyl hydrolase family 28 protein [Acidobacteriaceae bacterium]|nr:glycosyl hydrolase family 28 protein [Acidobacteriaceae bacterium]